MRISHRPFVVEATIVLAVGTLCSPVPTSAADVTRPTPASTNHFSLEHVNRIVRLSDPQLAPNGRSIVVVVQRAETDTNQWARQLVLVDVATGSHRPLTHERKKVGHPRWSPTGDRLAFLAPHGSGKDAADQIFVLPMNGGEAQQITKSPTSVQQFSWRLDGKEIAFTAADEAPNKKEIEKGEDAFEVGNDDMFTKEAPMPVHLWLVSSEGGEARRQTSGSWSLPLVLPPSPPASPLSWSPDGKRIAFVRQATPHSGDSDKCAVQIIDLATGAIQPLTGGSLLESFPSFSPDGAKVMYWCNRDHDPYSVNDLFVAPASGGPGTNFTSGLDRCLFQSIWMPDAESALTGGHDGTAVALWRVPLAGNPRRLNLGRVNPKWLFWVEVSVSKDGSIAFVGSEPDRPDELYYLPSADASPRRLTDFNAEIAALKLGRVETVQWSGPDGFSEDGTLVYPPEYEPGPKLPLVLVIHGGPQAVSTTSFYPLAQLLAARGYLVFSPNYRGSDNLGNAYQHAIFNDAGDGPDRDVMSGLESIKAKGIVDETRIAVTGWSYGGYMTAWLIGHHTFWKAAVAGAAVTDLTDEYCLSDGNVQWRYGFP
ncbi:MAG: prolyl oligopeptidase family serine peptidase, partial [Verrucomicrobia bacterium]|nr:prolyl oligopeptidase family serine peptidase [Verrucomicrobiota bacterium]